MDPTWGHFGGRLRLSSGAVESRARRHVHIPSRGRVGPVSRRARPDIAAFGRRHFSLISSTHSIEQWDEVSDQREFPPRECFVMRIAEIAANCAYAARISRVHYGIRFRDREAAGIADIYSAF